jgi:hypothetical protein
LRTVCAAAAASAIGIHSHESVEARSSVTAGLSPVAETFRGKDV